MLVKHIDNVTPTPSTELPSSSSGNDDEDFFGDPIEYAKHSLPSCREHKVVGESSQKFVLRPISYVGIAGLGIPYYCNQRNVESTPLFTLIFPPATPDTKKSECPVARDVVRMSP